jgi:hypothetical protein
MTELGNFVRAKDLLRRAARTFSPREAVARAKRVVAEAVSRDLGLAPLETASCQWTC